MKNKSQFKFLLISAFLLTLKVEASMSMVEGFCEILNSQHEIMLDCASKASQDVDKMLDELDLSKNIKRKHNLTTELRMIEVGSMENYLISCYLFAEKIEDLCAMENIKGFQKTYGDILSDAKTIMDAARKLQFHKPKAVIRCMYFYTKCCDPEATDFQLEYIEIDQVAKDSFLIVENSDKVLLSLRRLTKKYGLY